MPIDKMPSCLLGCVGCQFANKLPNYCRTPITDALRAIIELAIYIGAVAAALGSNVRGAVAMFRLLFLAGPGMRSIINYY